MAVTSTEPETRATSVQYSISKNQPTVKLRQEQRWIMDPYPMRKPLQFNSIIV